jgi:hypothetical protein
MLHVCIQTFDMTENLENFFGTKPGYFDFISVNHPVLCNHVCRHLTQTDRLISDQVCFFSADSDCETDALFSVQCHPEHRSTFVFFIIIIQILIN